jgi:MoxR-like ATPase
LFKPENEMTVTALRHEILKLPISIVLGAHKAFCNIHPSLRGSASEQKMQAAEDLVAEIQFNHLTIEDVKRAPPVAPEKAGPAPLPAAALGQIHDKLMDLDARTADVRFDISKIKDDLVLSNNTLKGEAHERKAMEAQLSASLENLSRKVGQFKIDDRKVEAAVAKIVSDAFKPFERAVQAAGAQTLVADLSSVHVIGTKTCLEAFGVDVLDRNGQALSVSIWNDPLAPAVDPHFIWTPEIVKHLVLSQDTGENVWLGGPKGTGKSETARQFAAVTGRAFTRINFHKYTSAEDYIGAVGLENGQTVFKRGDFLSAFTHPATVILLDEVTNADPGELAPLNGFLEPNSAVAFGGSVQVRAPGVLVFAADNTLGNGDDTGRYAGTRQMNSALVDRFARVVAFDYLPLAAEVEAVVRHTQCAPELAEHVLEAVNVARTKVHSGEVIDAPSIRSVIAFIRALKVLSVSDAWATTISARQPVESLPGLSAIYATCIDEQRINQYL